MSLKTLLATTLFMVGCVSTPAPEPVATESEALTPGTFVQEFFACPQSPTTSTTVKLKSATKVGDTLVVVAGWNDTTNTASTVTDSLGDTFALASDTARNTNAPDSQVVYYSPNIKAGTDTITVHVSASVPFLDVRVAEYSGVIAPVGSADSASNAQTASAGPLSLLSGDLLVGSGTTNGGFGAAGSGFTKRVITAPDENLLEDRLIATAGSYSATASDDGSQYVWQAVAFRAGSTDAGVPDGGDAATDAGQEAAVDAASETSADAPADVIQETSTDAEAGSDASQEAAVESGSDSSAEASVEAGNDTGTDATVDAGPPPSGPTLIQHVSSSTERLDRGISGNNLTFTPPNPILAGNALILGVAYTSGSTWAAAPVTDTLGNVWPSGPSAIVHDSQGNMDLAVFVLPGAIPGVDTVSMHWTASIAQFSYTFSEFAGVAGLNGTSGSSGVLAPNLTTSSFTPGNNDANGGNLIWSYFYDDSNFGSGNEVTSFTPGSGFTLLDADIAWHQEINLHHASEYAVQTTAAATTPGITATMSLSADRFAGVSVALKVAAVGTLPNPGIHIGKVLHATRETPPASITMQAPLSGNLIVFTTANAEGFGTVNSVTDNKGNSYTKYEPDGSEPQFFVAANATTGTDLLLTINSPSQAGISWSVYGISGASSAPVDAVAGMPSTGCSSVTSVSNAPSISPTGAGLTIAVMGQGQGPGFGVTLPAGAMFDQATYSGETDLDTLENADCRGHVYNTSAGTENWTWAISSQSNNSCFATAVHLLAQ